MWLSGGCGQLLRFLECDCAKQSAGAACLRDLALPRLGIAHRGKSSTGPAATAGFSIWHRFQVPQEATSFPLPTRTTCCNHLVASPLL
ncbi:S-adenosyl-L-methionine-dependent tRNA 4-demethylwyosine synthase [Trichinella spiralis]|uniref:S-adenosyl-L-methionine-dependent tRNA 4-demethylwyosine synthase n=1 Tax=Trichinella spiralis TaxID=6334 RepID=A0ABR3K4Q1_TRISP